MQRRRLRSTMAADLDFDEVLRKTAVDDPMLPEMNLFLATFNEEQQVQMLEVVKGNKTITNVLVSGLSRLPFKRATDSRQRLIDTETGTAGAETTHTEMSIQTARALADVILECPNVVKLSFLGVKVEGFGAIASVFEQIKDRCPIELELDHIGYTAGRLEEHMLSLIQSDALESLTLGYAYYGSEESRSVDLLSALASNRSIKRLEIRTKRNFSPEAIQTLRMVVMENSVIENIALYYDDIVLSRTNVLHVAYHADEDHSRLELTFTGSSQNIEGVVAFANPEVVTSMLANTPCITDLRVTGRRWNVRPSSVWLESLHLVTCGIGDEECQALTGVLETNDTLKQLNLADNRIGDAGAAALGRVLTRNTTIENIDLHDNRIGDVGAAALGHALSQDAKIENIDLRGNEIGPGGASAIAGGLSTNQSVKMIDIKNNPIGDDGATAVFEMLTTNDSIEFVGLQIVGEQAFNALIAFLPRMNTLEKFHLDGLAYLIDTAEDAFIQALEQNTVLVQLEDTWRELPARVEALLTRNRILRRRDRARRVLMRWPQHASSLCTILGESPQDADVLYFALRGTLLDKLFPRSGERDVANPSSESRDVFVPDIEESQDHED